MSAALPQSKASPNRSKIDRYAWGPIVDKPGELCWLDKTLLNIDYETYQRITANNKALEIASEFSWEKMGVILVSKREDGTLWVYDGAHRKCAADKRADITLLPCIVFNLKDSKCEAKAFLGSNLLRKTMGIFERHKAAVHADDEWHKALEEILRQSGVTPSKDAQPHTVKCLSVCLKLIKTDRSLFIRVLNLTHELSGETRGIQQMVLEGLFYIGKNSPATFQDKRFVQKLRNIGINQIMAAATRGAAFFAKSGAKPWAHGIVEAVNKGLKERFNLNPETADE